MTVRPEHRTEPPADQQLAEAVEIAERLLDNV